MTDVPAVLLNDGARIPQFGFGVFQIDPAQTAGTVATAFEAGYRHIDTAQGYGNEAEVGRAIADSGIPRDELYVTTKLRNDHHGHDAALAAFEESLALLGLDYIDLFLIHWPQPRQNRYVETWQALEQIAKDGRSRSIGVSNFQVPHLERLAAETATVPAVNQIELHPLLVQSELRAYHQEHGIVTEAWSPLAKGGELLSDELITGLARKYARTPAQIVLRWHIELGNVVFPKSATPSRIAENIDVFDFELAADDVAAISGLDAGTRTGPDPDNFG